MLDVTTNQTNINFANIGVAGGSLDDDDMEPLFDEDWLHEHNLDILFDLFEEEVERKESDASSSNSSSSFGTSPVTSYLFGTSPPFAPTLDIYDLLYLDNQPISTQQQQQATASSSTTNTTITINTTTTTTTTNTAATTASSSANPSPFNQGAPTHTYNINGKVNNTSIPNIKQQANQSVKTSSYIANSITNAMRIKRRLKKGQNEGVSLLARPLSNNNGCGSGGSTGNFSMINKNNSDKTSTKITNLKKPNCNDNCSGSGIDIDQTKQSHHDRNRHLHHYHHHVHHITGSSIIREHAYAVRGH